MTNWEKNREILIKHYGGFVKEITADDADNLTPELIKIETTPTGEPSLSIKGIHVHSPRDPAREAHRLAESAGIGNNSPSGLGIWITGDKFSQRGKGDKHGNRGNNHDND